MRIFFLAAILAASAASSFGQYSARRLTQRIAPQPAAPQNNQQQAATPAAPQPAPPVYPQYQYAATAPARPVDPAKAAAEKAKNEEKQFDYFKRRAEEGSDHAQYELGLRYLSGKGTAPDEKLGREWLAKASKNGNSQATKKLTEMGGEPEKVEATTATAITEKPAEVKPSETK